jgi:uncharacterized protein (DUF2336 family)
MAKSSAYSPLDGLLDLACRDGVDIRPTLLRVLTDLYVQKPAHTAEEETQYVELARGLIDAVDAATRAAVAARLSTYSAAPPEILERLAIASEQPAPQAPLETPAAPAARNDLLELFFAAKSDERRLILTNLDVPAEAAARQPLPATSETIRRLESAALQRNPSEFVRMLERALGVSHALAERITRDPSGEPIVVAARALGMSAEVLHRILLLLNPAIGHSVERVYDLARLFDELTPAAGAHMLSIWRRATTRPRPAHEPLHWDDERREARALSTPARYRADRGRITQPSCVKGNAK